MLKHKKPIYWGTFITVTALLLGALPRQASRNPAGLFDKDVELQVVKKETKTEAASAPMVFVVNRIVTNSGSILVDIRNKRAVFVSESQLAAERIDYDKNITLDLLKNSKEVTLHDYYNELYQKQLQLKYSNPRTYHIDAQGGVTALRESIKFEFLKRIEAEQGTSVADDSQESSAYTSEEGPEAH